MEAYRRISKVQMFVFLTTVVSELLIGHCCARMHRVAKQVDRGGSPAVALRVTDKEVVMDNGILQVTFLKPQGFVTAIKFGGLENLLEIRNEETNRGYWDIVWGEPTSGNSSIEADGCGPTLCQYKESWLVVGTGFKIIKEDENHAEISFMTTWSSVIQNSSSNNLGLPLNVDRRFIMLRGCSGFYSYGIFERKKGWPATDIEQIRAVYKLQRDKFHYMALSDKIQRVMPMPEDRETGKPLAYKEAVLLTHPINPTLKGEVDDKYQYSCEDKDNRVHGWISFNAQVGFWVITPSNEFRSAGPLKQDLTSHVGPTTLAMFHSNHYAGKDLTMSFQQGEPWKKVFGPFLVHLNSIPPHEDPLKLWRQAKEKMIVETKSWPYHFPASEDFPKSNQRGSVEGRLLVRDRFLNENPEPGSFAWVGLAAPGKAGSWQRETKGYQFWVQADESGSFVIEGIREGSYSLYAFFPGFVGDYKYRPNITILPGSSIKLGNLVYEPPRNGPTLWEIGIPDRSAAEFFIPDPRPNLTNRLYLHDEQNKYRQYGLWDRYTDIYPLRDLVYTVGVNNHRRDWFFAQVPRRTRNMTYKMTTWQIVFPLKAVTKGRNYTLQIALAAAAQAELQVRFNGHELNAEPDFTTGSIGRDNAIARHGIHGLYWLFSIDVPGSWLVSGSNRIFLKQSRGSYPFNGVMYDYIRFEGPPRQDF